MRASDIVKDMNARYRLTEGLLKAVKAVVECLGDQWECYIPGLTNRSREMRGMRSC